MVRDAEIEVPGSEPSDPINEAVYRYRGEGVSVGSSLEYIVRRLADEFAGAGDPRMSTSRRWQQLNSYIKSRDLTDRLQPELAAVARYLRTRQLAAHAATMIAQVGDSTQIFRVYYNGPDHKMDIVTMEDLKREVAEIRAGYEAVQAVGRTLDDDRPDVLHSWNQIPRAFVLGRL